MPQQVTFEDEADKLQIEDDPNNKNTNNNANKMEAATEPEPVCTEPKDITIDTNIIQEEGDSEFEHDIQAPVETIEEETELTVTRPISDQDHYEEIPGV
eukprot:12071278-Ditylum_brightwellii.AAC.1